MYFVQQASVGPYDFHDAENVDEITASRHKNGICIYSQSVIKIWQFWINKSKEKKIETEKDFW